MLGNWKINLRGRTSMFIHNTEDCETNETQVCLIRLDNGFFEKKSRIIIETLGLDLQKCAQDIPFKTKKSYGGGGCEKYSRKFDSTCPETRQACLEFLTKVNELKPIPMETITKFLALGKTYEKMMEELDKVYENEGLDAAIDLMLSYKSPNIVRAFGQNLLQNEEIFLDAIKVLLLSDYNQENFFRLGENIYAQPKLFSSKQECAEYALRIFCKAGDYKRAKETRTVIFHTLCNGVDKPFTKSEILVDTKDAEILIQLAKVIYGKNQEIERLKVPSQEKSTQTESPFYNPGMNF